MFFRDTFKSHPRIEKHRAERGGKRSIQYHNLGTMLQLRNELRKRDQVMRGRRNKRAGFFEPDVGIWE